MAYEKNKQTKNIVTPDIEAVHTKIKSTSLKNKSVKHLEET